MLIFINLVYSEVIYCRIVVSAGNTMSWLTSLHLQTWTESSNCEASEGHPK